MKVICHNTDYARDWHLIEPSDLLDVGKVYSLPTNFVTQNKL